MAKKSFIANLGCILLCILIYVILVFAAEFLGFLHPLAWILFPVVAAILTAFPVYYLVKRFGGKFVLLGLALVWAGLVIIEPSSMTGKMMCLMIGLGVIAELVHMALGYGKQNALRVSYPIFALVPFANIAFLWLDSKTYLVQAAEEMGADYTATLAGYTGAGYFILAIALVLLGGLIGSFLAEKFVMKK